MLKSIFFGRQLKLLFDILMQSKYFLKRFLITYHHHQVGVNFLNISSFQKIHILVAGSDQATYYAHSVLPSISHGIYPRTIFLLVDAKTLICAIFERLLFSHFLKEKKNNLTSLRSSEKSNRFSDTKGLSKRD